MKATFSIPCSVPPSQYCLSRILTSGRIDDTDELALGNPLCGDNCRDPRPKIPLLERLRIYENELDPAAQAISGQFKSCAGNADPHVAPIDAAIGLVITRFDADFRNAWLSFSSFGHEAECVHRIQVTTSVHEALADLVSSSTKLAVDCFERAAK